MLPNDWHRLPPHGVMALNLPRSKSAEHRSVTGTATLDDQERRMSTLLFYVPDCLGGYT